MNSRERDGYTVGFALKRSADGFLLVFKLMFWQMLYQKNDGTYAIHNKNVLGAINSFATKLTQLKLDKILRLLTFKSLIE
jgi:hypothetical protein